MIKKTVLPKEPLHNYNQWIMWIKEQVEKSKYKK